jgi:hypothetical protein
MIHERTHVKRRITDHDIEWFSSNGNQIGDKSVSLNVIRRKGLSRRRYSGITPVTSCYGSIISSRRHTEHPISTPEIEPISTAVR